MFFAEPPGLCYTPIFEQLQLLEEVLNVIFKEMRDWFCKNFQKSMFKLSLGDL